MISLLFACTKVEDDIIIPESVEYKKELIYNYLDKNCTITLGVSYDSAEKSDIADYMKVFEKQEALKKRGRAVHIQHYGSGYAPDQVTFKNSLYFDAEEFYFIPKRFDINKNGTLDIFFCITYKDSFVVQLHDHKISSNDPFQKHILSREDYHILFFLGLWQNPATKNVIGCFVKTNRLVWKKAKVPDTLIFINFTKNELNKQPTGACFYSTPDFVCYDSVLVLLAKISKNNHRYRDMDDYHSYLIGLNENAEMLWCDTLSDVTDQTNNSFLWFLRNGKHCTIISSKQKKTGHWEHKIILYDIKNGYKLRQKYINNNMIMAYYIPGNSNEILLISENKIYKCDTNLNVRYLNDIPVNWARLVEESFSHINPTIVDFESKIDLNNNGYKDYLITTFKNQILILDGKDYKIIAATNPYPSFMDAICVRDKSGTYRFMVSYGTKMEIFTFVKTHLVERALVNLDIILPIFIVFIFIPFSYFTIKKILYYFSLYMVIASKSNTQGIIILKKNLLNNGFDILKLNQKACELLQISNNKNSLNEIPISVRNFINTNLYINNPIAKDTIKLGDFDPVYLSLSLNPLRKKSRIYVLTIIDSSSVVKKELLSIAISIAHDAKNDLAEIQSRIENIFFEIKQIENEKNDWFKKEEIKLQESLSDIVDTLKKLLYSSNIQTSKKIKTNIYEIITNWIGIKKEKFQRYGIKLINNIIQNNHQLEIDEIHFPIMLQCICDNSKQSFDGKNENKYILFESTSDDNYINLKIVDNGCGMSENTINKVLNYNYTTKETGTGLGMKIIKKVCEEHNAELNIKSEINKGTTIIIKFKKD